jgi:hypothetical protein
MANDFGVQGSAIYARLGTVQYTYRTSGTATTTGSVPVYDTLAPQGGSVPYPYIIYQFMASVDEYKFAGGHGESTDILVKVISNRQFPSMQAEPIYAQAHAALQHAALTLNGTNLLRFERGSRVKYQDSDHYWHVGAIYRVDSWD